MSLSEASDDADFLGLFKDNDKMRDAVHERMAEIRAEGQDINAIKTLNTPELYLDDTSVSSSCKN